MFSIDTAGGVRFTFGSLTFLGHYRVLVVCCFPLFLHALSNPCLPNRPDSRLEVRLGFGFTPGRSGRLERGGSPRALLHVTIVSVTIFFFTFTNSSVRIFISLLGEFVICLFVRTTIVVVEKTISYYPFLRTNKTCFFRRKSPSSSWQNESRWTDFNFEIV